MQLRRGLWIYAVAGLVAATGVLLSLPQIGFSLEEDVGLQWLFRVRGVRPAPTEAVVVRFDRDTLARFRELPADRSLWPQPLASCGARLGGMPDLSDATRLDRLPREVTACLVGELTRRGAAVIAFDISFRRDPSREAGVAALAEAIRAHGRVVLLDYAQRQPGGPGGTGTNPGEIVQVDWLEGPHPELAQAAIATAAFPLPRSSAKIHQFWAYNPVLPSPTQLPVRALEVLALPALLELEHATEQPPRADLPPHDSLSDATGWLRARLSMIDGGVTPTELGRLSAADASTLKALARVYRGPHYYYLNFYGPPGTFPSISAADILLSDGSVSPMTELRGRVVFIGYQELAIAQAGDSFPTAFRGQEGVNLGGVEILATAFANLLHGSTLWALPEWMRLGLVATLGFSFALASCVGTVWRGLVLTLSLAAAYGAVTFACFTLSNLWLPVVVPLLALLPLSIGIGQLIHYVGAARWLGVYAPRQVSRRLLQGGDFGASSAQMREVTVMLTDIVGFTTLAEQSSPAAVSEFVNRHFTMLTACVEDEGGTVAQFIGDSVMSFWGAPDLQPDHAASACRTALAINRALEEENARRAQQGLAPVRMRIGINTGMVTAGNVGAPGRSNYGIVGDTVNITQRIEQLAKTLCADHPTTAILVSARTRALAGPEFVFDEAGAHELRGRREPVMIFSLQAAQSEATECAETVFAGAGLMPKVAPGHG